MTMCHNEGRKQCYNDARVIDLDSGDPLCFTHWLAEIDRASLEYLLELVQGELEEAG